MISVLQMIQSLHISISNFIDALCRPNPKYTPSTFQQQISHKRNKVIFLAYIGSAICFTCDIFIRQTGIIEDLLSIFFCVLILTSLVLSCQYHPQVFQCVYNFLNIIYGPSAVYSNSDSAIFVYIFIQVLPIFVQLMTGSYWHFFIQAIFQIFFLNTTLQGPMRKAISYSTPEEIAKDLTYAANLAFLFQIVLLVVMGNYIDQACKQAVDFELKKNEAESQKVFLLGFSHELRNLINSLTGNVKLASLENLGERAKELVSNAEVCGEMLLHLVNNILDTGKAHIGELEINPSPTKTYDALEKIWSICSELIRRKDLRGSINIPKDLPRTLMTDHHRLTQIFLNLVGNSIKFTESGSISIKVEWIDHKQEIDEECFKPYPFCENDEYDEGLCEKQINFSKIDNKFLVLMTSGGSVNKSQLGTPVESYKKGVLKFTVTDTGTGMNKEQTDKLFNKFTQVTTDQSKKKLGTGLGLFITRQLCRKMQGEIRVFSQLGKGTSFVICLPIETAYDHHLQGQGYIEAMKTFLASKSLNIMIVDDAPSNQTILRSFFDKFNLPVTAVALNGIEAYHKYTNYITRGEPLQIVAMDLDMPIMNGKEASQKIRELEQERNLKPCFLLIISGNCVDSEIKECLDKKGKIRANAFLKKPIQMDDLIRIVVSSFIDSESH